MKVALLYPPACDPTAPYLSVPTLAAYLRREGVDVVPVDANAEAFDFLLRGERLRVLAERVEKRLAKLERKPALTHAEQLAYAALWAARGDAADAPRSIDDAVRTLKTKADAFYDEAVYTDAIGVVESALRLISAAYAPLSLSFTQYRTPFSLLDANEVRSDARPERNPFHDYYAGPLLARLLEEKPDVIGISIAFPGQIQPAYALAHFLRDELKQKRNVDVHLTAGGPALTQLLQGLEGKSLDAAIGPFDTLVAYEGERALLKLVRDVCGRVDVKRGVIHGEQTENLAELPCPDFDGLPFDKYITPELVLPYDPTRGCYWGKCTFCHYGLAETGTARYRERPVDDVVAHLESLQQKHGTRVFYLSQDAVNPKTVLKLAHKLRERHAGEAPFRWATDMRPERSLSPELCAELRAGGALSMALGVESAAPRVLQLIDKGVPVDAVARAIENLAGADIGVEAMCFTDFPTETHKEAMATVRFVEKHRDALSLFICGEFDLTKGSLVAKAPSKFGVAETWKVEGDELGCGLFWKHAEDPKSDDERADVDEALAHASSAFRLARYPWAGALSTAHTLLWYARFGRNAFKRANSNASANANANAAPKKTEHIARAKFDVAAVMRESAEREAAIWDQLVNVDRAVSRARWRALADAQPAVMPAPSTWRFAAGEEPTLLRAEAKSTANRRPGRRVKHTATLSKDPVRGW